MICVLLLSQFYRWGTKTQRQFLRYNSRCNPIFRYNSRYAKKWWNEDGNLCSLNSEFCKHCTISHLVKYTQKSSKNSTGWGWKN